MLLLLFFKFVKCYEKGDRNRVLMMIWLKMESSHLQFLCAARQRESWSTMNFFLAMNLEGDFTVLRLAELVEAPDHFWSVWGARTSWLTSIVPLGGLTALTLFGRNNTTGPLVIVLGQSSNELLWSFFSVDEIGTIVGTIVFIWGATWTSRRPTIGFVFLWGFTKLVDEIIRLIEMQAGCL